MIALELPWPPSVNRYWRAITRGPMAGRVLISREGRQYRENVRAHVMSLPAQAMLTGRLRVVIEATPPDRRTRDLDNVLKAPLDALTHAGVIEDDGRIDALTISRAEPCSPGGLRIMITEYGAAA